MARRHKLASIANTDQMAAQLLSSLPELSGDGGWRAAAGTLLSVAGIWPLTNPTEAMLCVYEDPQLARVRIDFPTALHEILSVILAGCLARWPSTWSTLHERRLPLAGQRVRIRLDGILMQSSTNTTSCAAACVVTRP